jgi:hypothetical protein
VQLRASAAGPGVLAAAVLRAAPLLTRGSCLFLVDVDASHRPAAELLDRFFSAAQGPVPELLRPLEPSCAPMPACDPLPAGDEARYENLGRLIGYSALRRAHVRAPLPLPLLLYLTTPPTADPTPHAAADAVALLATVAPAAAHRLRRALARHWGTAPSSLPPSIADCFGGVPQPDGSPMTSPGAPALCISDGTKEAVVAAAAGAFLFGTRGRALAALRRGAAALLGAHALASLTPEALGLRLLGAEPLPRLELSPRARAPCAFVFHEPDWDEPTFLAAYKAWFGAYAQALAGAPPTGGLASVAHARLLLRLFGCLAGPPLVARGPICVLAGYSAHPVIVPDAGQLFLPAASSQHEFHERMSSACLA